jgi:hypothetical protein
VVFSYEIRPAGGDTGQALARGNLYISDLESAKRHVQAVTAPGVVASPGLEVILLDHNRAEIWRGPYRGNAA